MRRLAVRLGRVRGKRDHMRPRHLGQNSTPRAPAGARNSANSPSAKNAGTQDERQRAESASRAGAKGKGPANVEWIKKSTDDGRAPGTSIEGRRRAPLIPPEVLAKPEIVDAHAYLPRATPAPHPRSSPPQDSAAEPIMIDEHAAFIVDAINRGNQTAAQSVAQGVSNAANSRPRRRAQGCGQCKEHWARASRPGSPRAQLA